MSTPARKHYVYAIVDTRDATRTPLAVCLSRAEARGEIDAGDAPDAPFLRVRRGKLTLFET